MRICTEHWSKMKAKCEELGLMQFVAQDGEAAHAKIVEGLTETEDEHNVKTFDPLLGANFAVTSHFLKDVGIEGLAFDGCPLCEVEDFKAGLADNWINGCMEDQRMYAVFHGFMKLS